MASPTLFLASAGVALALAAAGPAAAQPRAGAPLATAPSSCRCGWPDDLEAALDAPPPPAPAGRLPRPTARSDYSEQLAPNFWLNVHGARPGETPVADEERCSALLALFSDPHIAGLFRVQPLPVDKGAAYDKRIVQRRALMAESEINGYIDKVSNDIKARGAVAVPGYVAEARRCAERVD
jgi:hypothetical protein